MERAFGFADWLVVRAVPRPPKPVDGPRFKAVKQDARDSYASPTEPHKLDSGTKARRSAAFDGARSREANLEPF